MCGGEGAALRCAALELAGGGGGAGEEGDLVEDGRGA